MAKKSPKRWVSSPKSAPKPKVPEDTKKHVQEQCDSFLENTLKPRHIQPPPDDARFNYIVDLYNLWVPEFLLLLCKVSLPCP